MREGKHLELKENIESNTFMKTISAYANYDGGKIIFGIDDNGNVKGILNPEEACLNLENKINDSMKPVPEYSIEIQDDSTIQDTEAVRLDQRFHFRWLRSRSETET